MIGLPTPTGARARAEEPYDFALIGAGPAGLSLAMQLVEAFEDATVCLIDPGLADLSNRTFAFWCEGPPPLRDAVSASWAKVRVQTPDGAVGADLDRYRYHVIEGTTFGEVVTARLRSTGRAWRVADAATTIEHTEHAARVRCNGGRDVLARWVFDSRLSLSEVPADPARHVGLTQRFLGWEIETPAPAFDPETITLFDFRVPQGADVRFVYVVPFTPRRALVEHVCHHAHPHAKGDLARYVEQTLGIEGYAIRRVESGDSPLTDAPFPRRVGPRALRIGIAGGRLKPSSGYAFTRIWEDSAQIVESLRAHGHPFDLPPDPRAFRILDGLMLRVMRSRPARMGAIFSRMFARNPADRVFAFLDERVGLDDVLALGSQLPPGPFAAALGESLRARLRDALQRLTTAPGYEDGSADG